VSRPLSRPKARQYVHGPRIYQRGAVWYARVAGKPDGVSLRTRDRAEAERRFHALATARLTTADVERPAREVRLTEAVTEWMDAPHGYTSRTVQSHRNRLLALGEWLAGVGVSLASEITPGVMDRWVKARSRDVSRTTINRDLRVLKVCLRWTSERGLTPRVAAVLDHAGLRAPDRPKVHVVPSPDEMVRVLASLEGRNRTAFTAVRALYATGLRIEELRRLTVADLRDGAVWVRPEGGSADTAEPGKGYRTRSIPLAPVAVEIVRAYLSRRAERAAAVSESWLIKALHGACDVAHVPRCGLHDLRRAFCTEAVRAGVPLPVVSRWLGHRLVRTTERYVAAYRSDGEIVAPVPAALTDCRKLPDSGVRSGAFQSLSGTHERRGRGWKP